MYTISDNKQKKIEGLINYIKLASLSFCAIITYTHFFKKSDFFKDMLNNSFNLSEVCIFIGCSLLMLCMWVFFGMKQKSPKYKQTINNIENIFFMSFFTLLIVFTDIYSTQNKLLFLFIIIISTIESGLASGLVTAVCSSSIILAIDLLFIPYESVDVYFQSDLILIGVFILTACALGYYVKLEQDNSEQKNLQLRVLSDELEEQDKQRKSIEEDLIRNKSCYNLLINNSREAILVHRNNLLLFVNNSAAKLLGLADDHNLGGKSITELIPEEELNIVSEKFNEIYNKKDSILSFQSKILKGDGSEAYIIYTSTYFIYEGHPTILSILSDVTHEKQVETLKRDVEENKKLLDESRELNKLTTEFFSNISHELKTPLNVIFAAIQTICLYNGSLEAHEAFRLKYINIMKQNCYRLIKLINNLLDLTRLDSGFLKLQLQNQDIVSLIENITLSVVTYIEGKSISIIFDTNVEEKMMACDPDKIERIILNLISNSMKFTNSGGRILVEVIDQGENVTVTVKDTGIGIPEDKLEIIFDRFGQVDKTFTRNREGSGIGLSLVKSFVEMHNGTIGVKSELGKGTEFAFTLPVFILDETDKDALLYQSNIERVNIEFSDIYSD